MFPVGVACLFFSWCTIMTCFDIAAAALSQGSLHRAHFAERHARFLLIPAEGKATLGFQMSQPQGVKPFVASEDASKLMEAGASASAGAAANTATAPAENSTSALVAAAEKESTPAATSPGQAPSLVQRLEGREGDLAVWVAIAAIFFLAGWFGGTIYARRRERARRGRLRF